MSGAWWAFSWRGARAAQSRRHHEIRASSAAPTPKRVASGGAHRATQELLCGQQKLRAKRGGLSLGVAPAQPRAEYAEVRKLEQETRRPHRNESRAVALALHRPSSSVWSAEVAG